MLKQAKPQSDNGPVSERAASMRMVFENTALVLLSLATVGTAWCSFQAAVWGSVSQRSMNLSAAASRRAAANELRSGQRTLVDVMLFSQYINARSASNETLARFYSDRFRDEAKTAFQAWMTTHPFENPDSPPHPFVPEFYKPRLLAEARVEESESLRLWQMAGEAGVTGRAYVLITVLLASALFCGGLASKFEKPRIRQAIVVLGLGVFIFAAVRLLSLPFRV
jgi:hypothetical protein